MFITLRHRYKKELDSNLEILNALCEEPFHVVAQAFYESPTKRRVNGGVRFEYHLYRNKRFEGHGDFQQLKKHIMMRFKVLD